MNENRTWLARRARSNPSATCLWWRGSRLSYDAVQDNVETLVSRLWSAGLRPTERLALVCEPSLRFVELFHAAQSIGAVLVPLAPRLTGAELGPLLERTSPALILADAASIPVVRGAYTESEAGRIIEAEHEIDAIAPAPPRRVQRPSSQDDPLAVLFTSGTSGRPKAAVLSYRAFEASAHAATKRLALNKNDRWLSCMPLHHVGGMSILVRNVVNGIPFELHEAFDANVVDRELRRGQATALSVVPTMLSRILEAGGGRPYPESLRIVLTGGGPLTSDEADRALAAHLPLVTTYGLTEAASQVCTSLVTEAFIAPSCVGPPLDGTEVSIREPGRDGVGEIQVRSATLMSGYLDDPEATKRALVNGVLRTGDLGRIDSKGNLHIECRRTDLIITGGENVYPAEVEAVLRAHPQVQEAVVVAANDPEWGQQVCALVTLSPRQADKDASQDSPAPLPADLEASLSGFCAERLAPFKRPRRLVHIAKLPATPTGKIDRRAAAEIFLPLTTTS